MKVAELLDYGGPENFRIGERSTPVPKDEEVLVKVAYAGLRWGDIMGRRGIPVRGATPPFVPGQEAVGTVADLGAGVTSLKVGDRVVCQPQGSGYAEYLAIAANRAGLVP